MANSQLESNKSQFDVCKKAITLNLLTLQGKKLSPAIVKQIPEVSLLELKEGGAFVGRINYFWDEAPRIDESALHVLWFKGGQLCRSRFSSVVQNSGNNNEIRAEVVRRIYDRLAALPQYYIA